MAETGAAINKFMPTTSMLDKVTDLRRFMLVATFLFSLDSLLIIVYQKNLLSAFKPMSAPEVSVSGALIFLGLYSFFMAVLFPFVRKVILIALTYVDLRMFGISFKHEKSDDLHYPSLLLRDALGNKDTVLLDILKRHEDEKKERNIDLNIGFSMVFLFFVNYFFIGSKQLESVSQMSVSWLDNDLNFFLSGMIHISIGIFILLLAFMTVACLNPYYDDRIYLPIINGNKEKTVDSQSSLSGQ